MSTSRRSSRLSNVRSRGGSSLNSLDARAKKSALVLHAVALESDNAFNEPTDGQSSGGGSADDVDGTYREDDEFSPGDGSATTASRSAKKKKAGKKDKEKEREREGSADMAIEEKDRAQSRDDDSEAEKVSHGGHNKKRRKLGSATSSTGSLTKSALRITQLGRLDDILKEDGLAVSVDDTNVGGGAGGAAWSYAAANGAAAVLPARRLCPVCGFPAPYSCNRCSLPFCSLPCRRIHMETRCVKFAMLGE